MQPTRKNVKDYLKIAGWILLSLFISIIVVLLSVIGFIPAYKSETGLIALGIFLVFLAYQTYRCIKHAENPWQTFKGNLKKDLIFLLSFAFSTFALWCLLILAFPPTYHSCDYYTEKLNGGVKEFQGKKFKINMCGTGGDDNSNNDEIRLEIFSEQGELLAERYFLADLGGSFDYELEYHPNHIMYFDSTDDNDFDKTIPMPPTAIDWLRARLPSFNNGIINKEVCC